MFQNEWTRCHPLSHLGLEPLYYGDGTKLKNQLSSWAKALCPTVILAKGSASDKSFVPKNTAKPRKKHTRKTSVRSTVKHGARQQKRLIRLRRCGKRTGREAEVAAALSVVTGKATANLIKEVATTCTVLFSFQNSIDDRRWNKIGSRRTNYTLLIR